jgi:lipopolysaccharide export system permease protein
VRNLIAGQDSRTGAWRVFEFAAGGDLKRVYHAKTAEYAHGEGWRLNNAIVENLPAVTRDDKKTNARVEVENRRSVLLASELTPAILGVLTIKPESMGISQLNHYLGHLRENHQATRRYEIALWSKAFYPLAIFVMLALAMPFGYLNARSGGVSIKIFIGLMIGISFYTLNNIFSFLGVLHTWPPVVTAITPTVLMLILATIAMWLVERR